VKITDLHLIRVRGEIPPEKRRWSIERQIGALDLYPEYRDRMVTPPAPEEREQPKAVSGIFLKIETDEGITGTFGDIMPDQAFQIDTRLREHLIGADPIANERIWDVLSRHDRHGRKGYMMMAISAVDIALWDIRAKAAGMPAYRLLGGPTREQVPAYASCLGMSLEPEKVYERARELKAEGFTAMKWFFHYGPSHGRQGIEQNMTLVRTLREAVGDDVDLMFDAWLGWDVPYAIEMGKRMAPYNPRWLEEPVAPDRVGAYAEIRNKAGIPISGGEHVYTRWGFKVFLDAGALDVVQADPDWTGGISELVKIVTLTSAYDKQVIPHGHSVVPALNVIASQSPNVCPLLEYLLVHADQKQWFQKEKFEPVNGLVRLPTEPGLGIELDEDKVLEREELSWR
jgi:L-alanine-DL-glutamate epimerase-like enolase superfamily enzyme